MNATHVHKYNAVGPCDGKRVGNDTADSYDSDALLLGPSRPTRVLPKGGARPQCAYLRPRVDARQRATNDFNAGYWCPSLKDS